MAFVVVNGTVVADGTGASVMLPVLLTPEGIVKPLVDYCLTVRRSMSWHNKFLRAARLFLQYATSGSNPGDKEWQVFRNFANVLRSGTVDAKSGIDPSGLYWLPMHSRDINQIIVLLSDFFDWLGRGESPHAKNFNPEYQGNAFDQKIDMLAYRFRRSKAFLGHAWSGEPIRHSRLVRGDRAPKIFPLRPPSFPEEKIEELLFSGFKIAGKHDFRGMAITCLLFGGGLRVSEPFHLYIDDVTPHWDDPTIPFVAIHHPTHGIAPNGWKNHAGKFGTRKEYLASRFGLLPRNELRGKLHAGWKHPALDDRWYMQVHWFPKGLYGKLFLQIWRRYLEQIASIERNHPFAWVNIAREPVGGIYTVSSYLKSLQSAVERIGLVYGKTHGTTAHGPRHAYGQRARQGQISEVIIQRIMHHSSPESQQVYTQPELKEAAEAVAQATELLAARVQSPQFSYSFDSLGGI